MSLRVEAGARARFANLDANLRALANACQGGRHCRRSSKEEWEEGEDRQMPSRESQTGRLDHKTALGSGPVSSSTIAAFLRDQEQRSIHVLGVIALAFTLAVRVIFSDVRAWFWHGGELADVASELCIAYLAAWLFYYFVSWRPLYLSRRRVAKVIAPQALGAWVCGKNVVGALRRLGMPTRESGGPDDALEDEELYQPITLEECGRVCLNVFGGQSPGAASSSEVEPQRALSVIWDNVRTLSATADVIMQITIPFDTETAAAAAEVRRSSLAVLVEAMPSRPQLGIELQLLFGGAVWVSLLAIDKLWRRVSDRYREEAGASELAMYNTADYPLIST